MTDESVKLQNAFNDATITLEEYIIKLYHYERQTLRDTENLDEVRAMEQRINNFVFGY